MITGYLNYRNDKDFYLIDIGKRSTKTFIVTGIDGSVFKISITDPAGYITRTEKVSSKKGIKFKESIDGKGYIIIESVKEKSGEPYTIQIED